MNQSILPISSCFQPWSFSPFPPLHTRVHLITYSHSHKHTTEPEQRGEEKTNREEAILNESITVICEEKMKKNEEEAVRIPSAASISHHIPTFNAFQYHCPQPLSCSLHSE